MTANIIPGSTFLGTPMVTLRNLLKSWEKSDADVGDLASRKDVQMDPRCALAALSEMEANDLITWTPTDKYDPTNLTDAGLGLAYADAARRTSKKAAQVVLADLMKRVRNSAKVEGAPEKVTKVWLFGSMLDDTKQDVADIDFVIETERTRDPKEEWGDYTKALAKRFKSIMPANIHSLTFHIVSHIMNRLIFGNKRHRLLAPNELSTLKNLHVPCKLIYDAERGGMVNDPILPHHPDSEKRQYIKPKRYVPTLKQTGKLSNAKFLHGGYSPSMSQFKRIGSTENWPSGVIVTNAAQVADMLEKQGIANKEEYDFSDVNGRDNFLIWFSPYADRKEPKGWISIKRSKAVPEDDNGNFVVSYEIKCTETKRGNHFVVPHIMWAHSAIDLLIGADLKLLHEEAFESGKHCNICAEIKIDPDTPFGDGLHYSMQILKRNPNAPFSDHIPERDRDRVSIDISTTENASINSKEESLSL